MGCNSSAPAVGRTPVAGRADPSPGPSPAAPPRRQRGPPARPAALPRSPRHSPDEEDPAAAINPFCAALEPAAVSGADASLSSRVQALEALLTCPQQAAPTLTRAPFALAATAAAAAAVVRRAEARSINDDDDALGDPAFVLYGFLNDAAPAVATEPSPRSRAALSAQRSARGRGSGGAAGTFAQRTEGVLHYSPHASPAQSVGSVSPVQSSLTTVGSF